jgi:hypothetical protein
VHQQSADSHKRNGFGALGVQMGRAGNSGSSGNRLGLRKKVEAAGITIYKNYTQLSI